MVEDFEEGNSQLLFPEFNGILQEANGLSIKRRKLLGRERGTKVDQIGKYWDPTWETVRGKRSSYLDGFSLHANVAVSKKNREGLEKPCRYVARGPIAESRLNLDESENVIYELKKTISRRNYSFKIFTPRIPFKSNELNSTAKKSPCPLPWSACTKFKTPLKNCSQNSPKKGREK